MTPELAGISGPVAAIAAAVGLVVALGIGRAVSPRAAIATALVVLAWLGGTYALAATGVFARWDMRPPPAIAPLAIALIAAIVLARSRWGARLAGLPVAAQVGLQAFRLPLELAMHRAAGAGVPIELTFTGFNFDIAIGASAIAVAILAALGRATRAVVVLWNAAGMASLAVVAAIAIATLPPVHAFGDEPAHLNTWIAVAPFVWVPTLLVPVALAGHLILMRRPRPSAHAGR